MNIILNHSPEVIETNQQTITIADLLVIKNFTYEMLLIKINDIPYWREDYSTTYIKDGDNVQVIHMMSGG